MLGRVQSKNTAELGWDKANSMAKISGASTFTDSHHKQIYPVMVYPIYNTLTWLNVEIKLYNKIRQLWLNEECIKAYRNK